MREDDSYDTRWDTIRGETLLLKETSEGIYERVGVGKDVYARFFDDCEPQCLTLV